MNQSIRDWSSLLQDLLPIIADKLEFADYWRFRAVCKTWNSVPPSNTGSLLHSNLPYEIRPVPEIFFVQSDKPLFLIAANVYLLQLIDEPDKSWVVSIEEIEPGKLRFLQPLHRMPVENLDIARLFNLNHLLENRRRYCVSFEDTIIPGSLNLSNIRVSLLKKGYKFFNGRCDPKGHFYPKIVIVSGDKDDDNVGRFEGSMAIVLVGNKSGHNLFSVHLGSGQYTPITYDECSHFKDIESFGDDGVCAIDDTGRLYLIDHRSFKVLPVISTHGESQEIRIGKGKSLFRAKEGLYMIDHSTKTLHVYKFNDPEKQWDEIHSLDGRILFVSWFGCFFVEANLVKGCRGNCIIYPSNFWRSQGIQFSIKEGPWLCVFYMGQKRSKLMTHYEGLSDLFWPPSSWILKYSSSNGITRSSAAPLLHQAIAHSSILSDFNV